jgi:YVTN family beta-propeller protein
MNVEKTAARTLAALALVAGTIGNPMARAQGGPSRALGSGRGQELREIWGRLVAPVYGTSEVAPYSGAELFAGPQKLGPDYFAGVLSNRRMVKPAGTSVQVGMNPLGTALTPDGKFLVTTNDDERDALMPSLQDPTNLGGYTLSVISTADMKVVSTAPAGPLFVGLVVTGQGPYQVWAAGGPDNSVKALALGTDGTFALDATGRLTYDSIPIPVITPQTSGAVSHYAPDASFNTPAANGFKPPVPSGFARTGVTAISFPAGMALGPDGRFLYVACNGDNSLAIVDTASRQVVNQLAVGYFPYGVAVSPDGQTVYVTNWGVSQYRFSSPAFDPATGKLVAIFPSPGNQPAGFFVPETDTTAGEAKTSSVSVVSTPNGDPTRATVVRSVYLGRPLDALRRVGDTHPSALALVRDTLYVTKTNVDTLALLPADRAEAEESDELAGTWHGFAFEAGVTGLYPNAIAVSRDGSRAYVAEAGLNSVAVLDTRQASRPRLLGRIPTGWYPTGVVLSPDDRFLYVVNAKGIGEDVNPRTAPPSNAPPPTGIQSFTDGNFIFGTVQKVDLASWQLDNRTVASLNFALRPKVDARVVPVGGHASRKIKHVFFILHENKTFDSMLGSLSDHFGPFASTTFNGRDGSASVNAQFTAVDWNTQGIARRFATAVNYYSDSEESDAGHQFAASGTATDYTEKTLLVKSGRGLLVNKNFEPEDYPAAGYIFNNAARNGVSFKDYGALVRIEGTDTGTSQPTTSNDPASGNMGYPQNATPSNPNDVGDVSSDANGLGQSYFLRLPVLAVLGGNNPSGEPRLDRNYPGYNFNISDQRRAREFIKDFDRMIAEGTLPQFVYIYQPNDHTGGTQAPNPPAAPTAAQQVADGDVALGMVVQHIMESPVYYDPRTGEGAAIFITFDDAQSTLDHIHEHRTPAILVSPYARPGYLAKQHYATASIVKTEELLLGLPPNNLGDLLATDMREMFQPTYNGIEAKDLQLSFTVSYRTSPEGRRIWSLVARLDTSAPDRDSRRLGALARISMEADRLHRAGKRRGTLGTKGYRAAQEKLYATAVSLTRDAPAADAAE